MTLSRRARLRFSCALAAAGLLAGSAAAALAQGPPAPPADAYGAKAHAVLERHCARCHQQGRLERVSPAAGFGHVLQLDRLVREDRLVHGGNPDGSRLWTHMMRRLMPYDVYQEHNGGTAPDAEEILAVRDWIERATAPHARRGAGFARARAHQQAAGAKPEPVLTVVANRKVYTPGDVLKLRVSSTADCRLTLISIDARGRGTVIFPNELASSNALSAGQELTVPADDAGYLFRLKEPGRERVVGLCNLETGAVDGIRHDLERQRFTDLGDYRTFLAKAIAGEAAERGRGAAQPAALPQRRRAVRRRRAPPPPEPVAAPQKVLRTGIVLEVR